MFLSSVWAGPLVLVRNSFVLLMPASSPDVWGMRWPWRLIEIGPRKQFEPLGGLTTNLAGWPKRCSTCRAVYCSNCKILDNIRSA